MPRPDGQLVAIIDDVLAPESVGEARARRDEPAEGGVDAAVERRRERDPETALEHSDAFRHRLLCDPQILGGGLESSRVDDGRECANVPEIHAASLTAQLAVVARRDAGCLCGGIPCWFTGITPRGVAVRVAVRVAESGTQRAVQRARISTVSFVERVQRAIRLTEDLNAIRYAEQEAIRDAWSELTGQPVDESFHLIPPVYSDHGVNIRGGAGSPPPRSVSDATSGSGPPR
jgi:hypothetical protein